LKKKILITGGNGFIGQNIAQNLLKYSNLTIVDNNSSKAIGQTSIYKKNKVQFFKDNIYNKKKIENIFKKKKFDFVIHCAANFANQNSIDHPRQDLNSNITGTLNLLQLSNKYKIKKFIYLSSSCVYSSNLNLSEDSPLRPIETPYAISKFSAELYVEFFSSYYGLNSSIIRVFNTYGPGELAHKYRNVIPRFINQALKNKDISITGTGNEIRDFTYVYDLVRIIKKILKDKKKFLIINSCTGKKTSINVLVEKIKKICKSKSKIIKLPKRNWDKIKLRSGSIKKRKKFLSHSLVTPLDIGLRKTINWYKNNII